ncbi:hypothetical protein BL250_00155 [Erwinia sp. OLTSP20]|uniref:two-component system QseEF-associated lipoprotein QseG n=1 Tax=unclassified Erwinia TaxID=2622719 RepID=UPI000C654DEE|nr:MULTISPECIES: two-component system QseEF-associated lipoprotein QseG [unclassified Erwinia]PIJ52326.1 hypothetical protein BV501_00155 [Erwinia sp. OAMSP11]PIJ73535.1 hypothetical protein BK416_06670 [Erwinia sp. OLSSP12]PIJ85352.1 hypothetical protein BLD47_00480 [Erwinia sp. OLCASP19]PIJ87594.1 hypothetical protein BLD46_00155 [Erwinia sp. OLMTSP26]PIJ89101.1 hypothetical protein BLD49_00155 [Erwinia sp. OLMDSP33]
MKSSENFTRAYRGMAVLCLSLSVIACSVAPPPEASADMPVAAQTTPINVSALACDTLWSVNDKSALSHPLYWLRALDCALRLSPAEARAQAHNLVIADWQSAFKQGILLDNGNVTPPERRAYLGYLDRYQFAYPMAVRPLIQLWRQRQMAELQLADARMRYAQLQQQSDTELDRLRHQQTQLQQQLTQTQRKLHSLTDIERQLSSRRSADSADAGHGKHQPAETSSDNAPGGAE